MTVNDWLKSATAQMNAAGIGTARLDSLVLLEDVTGRDRAWLLAHAETEIKPAEVVKLQKLLSQRARHTPLSYVRGTTEFYGRNFVITPAVLEPRPESETMIDLLKTAVMPALKRTRSGRELRLADVGTGSGALGITAKLEFPDLIVDLLELDAKAIKVANINVDKFTLSISVMQSDLLDQTDEAYEVLLCNLPYVPDSYHINTAAMQEPKLAIFGGRDGLDVYRRLFDSLRKRENRPLFILTESLPPQHAALQEIADSARYHLQQADDFIQLFRRTEI